MKSIFNGSALIATASVLVFSIVSVRPSVAETPSKDLQQSRIQQTKSTSTTEKEIAATSTTTATAAAVSETDEVLESGITPPVSYVATAYSLRGRTASGRLVSKGIIAADRRVLPLGSRVRIEAGSFSGEYLVADTGGLIRGRRIDIWTPSSRDAMRFGRRTVKLTVLSYPAKGVAKSKRATNAQNAPSAGTAK